MHSRIAIFGSTGSIGQSTLDVIEHLGPPYRAAALSAHRQAHKLLAQARKFKPSAVALTDGPAAMQVAHELSQEGIEIYHGTDGLTQIARRADVDVVLAAIVGAAGLPAIIAAAEAGKRIALANKEPLVMAGALLMPLAKKHGAEILPVDSEHSAVFQALACGRLHEVRRVILTASGGPFRNATRQQIESATIADALNHPTWRMGHKITIDSATLFNKALELIEACWLFDLPPDKVQIVIHPESVVHSMVEFVDGSVIAQLSPPDMRMPIQYALTYPHRKEGATRRLDISRCFSLNFQPPDLQMFPAIRLAYEAVEAGGTMGAVLNAANETAVAAFLGGKIPFVEIARVVETTMKGHTHRLRPSLADLREADAEARKAAQGAIDSITPPAAGAPTRHTA